MSEKSDKPAWLQGPEAWEREQDKQPQAMPPRPAPTPAAPAAQVQRASLPAAAGPTQPPLTFVGYIVAGSIVMLAGAMFLAVDDFEWMGFVGLGIGGIFVQIGVIAGGVRLGIQSAGQ